MLFSLPITYIANSFCLRQLLSIPTCVACGYYRDPVGQQKRKRRSKELERERREMRGQEEDLRALLHVRCPLARTFRHLTESATVQTQLARHLPHGFHSLVSCDIHES